MHTLSLTALARSRLSQQLTLNGVFVHTLYSDNGECRATAAVTIEQCDQAVSVRVKLGDSMNSITLAHQEDTAERVALILEELANGVTTSEMPDVDECLTISISELDKRLLSKGIAAWRRANADIDTAIKSENWYAIESAQQDRSLHANTIALIFHKYTGTNPEQGLHS